MRARPPKPDDRTATPRHRATQSSSQSTEPEILEPEPPRIDTVPSSIDEFEQAVGRAITNWQEVEEALCTMFVIISTCSNENVARAIYWTIREFSVKLTIVRNAARIALDEEAMGRFTKLRSSLIQASELRNAIAHYHMIFYGTAPGHGSIRILHSGEDNPDHLGANHEATMEIKLMPYILDPNTHFKPDGAKKPEWLNSIRIRNASTKFLKLARTIDTLTENIRQPREQHELHT